MIGPYQSMPPAGGAENGRSCLASHGQHRGGTFVQCNIDVGCLVIGHRLSH